MNTLSSVNSNWKVVTGGTIAFIRPNFDKEIPNYPELKGRVSTLEEADFCRRTVYLTSIPNHFTAANVREVFCVFGDIEDVEMEYKGSWVPDTTFCFVTYKKLNSLFATFKSDITIAHKKVSVKHCYRNLMADYSSQHNDY